MSDAETPPGALASRRGLLIAAGLGAAVLLIIIVIVAIAAGGDDDPETASSDTSKVSETATETASETATESASETTNEASSDTAESTVLTSESGGSATSTTTAPTSTTSISPSVTEPTGAPPATTTAPVVVGPTTPDDPDETLAPIPSAPPEDGETQPSIPFNEIPDGGDRATCEAINDRLRTYRQLAIESSMEALLDLRLGLAEFEDTADVMAQGAAWWTPKFEQMTLVRRDWSTAYSADQSGDSETALARWKSALGYLDAAIDAPCP